MKIAVFGNRTISDNVKVIQSFDSVLKDLKPESITLLHGGAAGPATAIVEASKDHPIIDTVLFKPWNMVWSKMAFDPILFYMRNKQIVENADLVVIFSNGEKDSEVYRVQGLCERKGLKVINVEITNGES